MANDKYKLRERRKIRIKSKLHGTAEKPRLIVFRSLIHTYAQLIDDDSGKIIIGTSDIKSKVKGTKVEKAKNIGLELAKLAKDKKVSSVIFDRNGYKYHGRVKAIAEGAREGGLKF